MRRAWLASVAVLLMGARVAFAQPAALPPQPVPVVIPVSDPPPPTLLPAPTPIEPPAAAPSTPPPPLPELALDCFATRFWISADYLLWWIKDSRLPALLTTGSLDDAVPGALGQPATQILFGGDVNNPVRSGARFRGGYWFTPNQTLGMDGSFFFLGNRSVGFGAGSDGDPLLTRPFLDAGNGQQNAFIVAYPGRQSGTFLAALSSRLWGAEANLRGMLSRGPYHQISVIGGFRFLDLKEQLRMEEMDAFPVQDPFNGTGWTTSADYFHTSNQFYGGQIGTELRWCRGRFFVDAYSKVALGASVESAGINGWSSYSNSAGRYGSLGIGELALPSNLGCYGQGKFAVVPEAGINVGFALTQHIRLMFGYTFLFWSNVFRPGDQIDSVVNPTEFSYATGRGPISGPLRPTFTFRDSDFWAQGLNFGVAFRY